MNQEPNIWRDGCDLGPAVALIHTPSEPTATEQSSHGWLARLCRWWRGPVDVGDDLSALVAKLDAAGAGVVVALTAREAKLLPFVTLISRGRRMVRDELRGYTSEDVVAAGEKLANAHNQPGVPCVVTLGELRAAAALLNAGWGSTSSYHFIVDRQTNPLTTEAGQP